ncbi:MAG: hypothetical protein RJA66_1005 [Actinomycetota bacterium]
MIKRIIALFVIAAGIFSIIWFAPQVTLTVGDLPKADVLKVKAQDLSLVCPGGAFRTGGASGTKLGAFEAIGNPEINSDFNGPDGTSMLIRGSQLTAVDPAGRAAQSSLLLNANQVQAVTAEGLTGLTGAACQRPTNSLWFVGGDTSTGRESLLIVKNVTKVDSTVSLEIFNERGRVTGSGMSGISVAAGKTTVIPLASYVPKTKTFTTHVVSHGGLVAAWIQQKTIRGLASGGVDYVSPTTAFATTQAIPGVFIRGAEDAAKLVSKPDFADLVPTLRVFVPGSKAATVTAQVLGSTAKTFGTVVRQTIPGGTTADIALPGLMDGDFVAIVKSDQPVGSAIRLHRIVKTAIDFAWLTAADAQTGTVGFSVPSSGISKLSLANLGASAINLKLVQAGSAPATFKIPAAGQLTLKFAPGAKIELFGNGKALFGTLIVDVDGSVAAIPLVDYKNPGGEVAVMVR